MTKGFFIYFALCIKNRIFYVLNNSIIATFPVQTSASSSTTLPKSPAKDKEPHTKPKQHLFLSKLRKRMYR